MSNPTAKTCDNIQMAVHMRVDGLSWDEIAKELKYKSGESARNTLMVQNRDLWNATYEPARLNRLDEVEQIGLSVQIELAQDPKVKQYVRTQAAASLLQHVARMRSQRVELTGEGGKPLLDPAWQAEIRDLVGILNRFPDAKQAVVDHLRNGRLNPGN